MVGFASFCFRVSKWIVYRKPNSEKRREQWTELLEGMCQLDVCSAFMV